MQVPVRHLGLVGKGVAPLVVGMVADVAGIETVHELERAVVQRQAQDAHVVGVHDTVAETQRLPVRQQRRRAQCHGLQQGRIRVGLLQGFGVKARHDVVGQLAQFVRLAVKAEVLEVSEADKARRQTRHHRRGLRLFALHRLVRPHEAERARRRHAQRMHGFAAEKFADA